MKKSAGCILLAAFLCACAQQQNQHDAPPDPASITLHLDTAHPGPTIPDEFSGVSIEMHMVLAGRDGSHFFDPTDHDLVAIFRTLGIRSLRVGGNSLDMANAQPPSDADIDSLYAFAKAANLRIIYSVKMRGVEASPSDPSLASDVHQVKYLWSKYADLTQAVTIGNEPNIFFADSAPGGIGTAPATAPGATTTPKLAVLGGVGDSGAVGIGYAAYKKRWEQIASAIIQEVPAVRLCGPSSTPGKVAWAGAFAKDEARSPFSQNLAFITQHSYPGGNAQKVTDAGSGRELILSDKMETGYEKFYATFAPEAQAAHKPFRLEESNSLFHGGATNISNTHGSALWALDFMWWWASHNAAGINFHTNMPNTSEDRIPGGYDFFWNTPSGIKIHPIAYAAKAFALAGHGQILPLTLDNPSHLNLTAYAAGNQNEIFLTLINRENTHGALTPATPTLTIHLDLGTHPTPAHWQASILYLRPGKDGLASLTGETLGNAPINGTGTWTGQWQTLPNPTTLELPPAQAAILHLHRN